MIENNECSNKETKPVGHLGLVSLKDGVATIDAGGLHYRDLNFLIKSHSNPVKRIDIHNVNGQRYIGTNIKSNIEIHVYGTPGNDLAAFMDGPAIYVHGNAQDGIGNTMNNGKVIVYGRAGDIAGYGMRGGKIFIRDDAGYRVGIHMKEYAGQKPILVVGGKAQDFLGEYMAGGILVVLGTTLKDGEIHKAKFVGTGMHGGTIYIRGQIDHVGKEVKIMELEKSDVDLLEPIIKEYCSYFSFNPNNIAMEEFKKLVPFTKRPYGTLYAW